MFKLKNANRRFQYLRCIVSGVQTLNFGCFGCFIYSCKCFWTISLFSTAEFFGLVFFCFNIVGYSLCCWTCSLIFITSPLRPVCVVYHLFLICAYQYLKRRSSWYREQKLCASECWSIIFNLFICLKFHIPCCSTIVQLLASGYLT